MENFSGGVPPQLHVWFEAAHAEYSTPLDRRTVEDVNASLLVEQLPLKFVCRGTWRNVGRDVH